MNKHFEIKILILILISLVKLNHCQIFASAHKLNLIKLWSVNSHLKDLTGHTDEVIYLELLPNNQLASCSLDNTIRIWDIQSGNQLYLLNNAYTKSVKSITLVNETLMATQSTNFGIVLWNLNGFSVNKTIINVQTNALFLIKMLKSHPLLASASSSNSMRIWNIDTSQMVHEFNFNSKAIIDFDILPDGKITIATSDNTVHIYDLNKKAKINSFANNENISKLKALLNGNIVIGFSNGLIKICYLANITTNTVLNVFKNHQSQIESMDQLNDTVFLSGASAGAIRIWNLTDSRELYLFDAGTSDHANYLLSINISLETQQTMSTFRINSKIFSMQSTNIITNQSSTLDKDASTRTTTSETSVNLNSETTTTSNTVSKATSLEFTVINLDQTTTHISSILSYNLSSFSISSIEPKEALKLLEKYDMNDCLTNCSFNGYCKMNELNQFICECFESFFIGSKCEIDLRKCSSDNACLNNGTCLFNLTSNSYKCECDEFHYGKNCEHKIDICKNETCSNKGNCEDVNKQAKCNCYSGYYGSKCELEKSERQVIRQVISTTSIIAIAVMVLLVLILVLIDISTFISQNNLIQKKNSFQKNKRNKF